MPQKLNKTLKKLPKDKKNALAKSNSKKLSNVAINMTKQYKNPSKKSQDGKEKKKSNKKQQLKKRYTGGASTTSIPVIPESPTVKLKLKLTKPDGVLENVDMDFQTTEYLNDLLNKLEENYTITGTEKEVLAGIKEKNYKNYYYRLTQSDADNYVLQLLPIETFAPGNVVSKVIEGQGLLFKKEYKTDVLYSFLKSNI